MLSNTYQNSRREAVAQASVAKAAADKRAFIREVVALLEPIDWTRAGYHPADLIEQTFGDPDGR